MHGELREIFAMKSMELVKKNEDNNLQKFLICDYLKKHHGHIHELKPKDPLK